VPGGERLLEPGPDRFFAIVFTVFTKSLWANAFTNCGIRRICPCVDWQRRSEFPHLSDIELGRRFPSEEILAKLAGTLEVSPDELKQYDTRAPIADLKRLIDLDPKLGFAFRTVVEKVKNGELTAEDIIVKLSKRKSRA